MNKIFELPCDTTHSLKATMPVIRKLLKKNSQYKLGQSTVLFSLLSACGGGSGEGSTSQTPTVLQTSSGRVIDGYISSARVFRDVDNDFLPNSNEASVITTQQGRYV